MFADPAKVKLIVLDVDGCLTDGSVYLDNQGNETKRFNIKDGLAIAAWIRLGFEVAIITGRSSGSLSARCKELGIDNLHQGVKDKGSKLSQVLAELGVSLEETAAIGDDWNDLPVLERVGFAMCPADAVSEVRSAADYVCQANGGHGAVREAIEHIIDAKGLREAALSHYRG